MRELWESHPFDSPGDCTIVSRSAWIEEATRIAGDVGAIHVSRVPESGWPRPVTFPGCRKVGGPVRSESGWPRPVSSGLKESRSLLGSSSGDTIPIFSELGVASPKLPV